MLGVLLPVAVDLGAFGNIHGDRWRIPSQRLEQGTSEPRCVSGCRDPQDSITNVAAGLRIPPVHAGPQRTFTYPAEPFFT